MPEQQAELFERTGSRHPGARQQWAPRRQQSTTGASIGEEARNAALKKLQADGEADYLRAQYARLLWRAAKGKAKINGRRPRALTDKEAAHLMGRQVSTITGRRNELMGTRPEFPEYQACPVVLEAGKRRPLVNDAGVEVTTYRFRLGLFD